MKRIFIFLAVLGLTLAAQARFTYEGYLTDVNGNPINSQVVRIRLQVLPPASSVCLLFQEYHDVTTNTDGYFSVTVGSGTPEAATGLNFDSIFSNTSSLTNLSPCTYTPTAYDGRRMSIFVSSNGGVNYDGLGTLNIHHAPMAMTAERLGSFAATNFLRGSTGVAMPTLGSAQVSALSGLIAGNISASSLLGYAISNVAPANGQVLQWNGSQWSPATVSGGTIGGGTSGVSSVSVNSPLTISGGTTSTPTIGITQAGTAANGYLAATDWVIFNNKLDRSGGTMTGELFLYGSPTTDSSAATKLYVDTAISSLGSMGGGGGGVTSIATGAGLIGGPITTAGTISLATSGVTSGTFGGVNVIPVVTVDPMGRLTNVGEYSLNVQSTNGGSSIVGRDGSGNFAANTATLNSLNLANSGLVSISTPIASSYSMRLPSSIGVAGQVLSTDGSLQLNWINMDAGVLGGFPNGSLGSPGIHFASQVNMGIYRPGFGNMAFTTNGSVESIRITNTGAVGINTTTPQAQLDVQGGIRIGFDAGTCVSGKIGTLRSNGGVLEICNGTSWGTFGEGGEIGKSGNSFGSSVAIGTNDNYELSFRTSGANRMTILPSGEITIGTGSISVGAKVVVDGGALSINDGNEIRFGELTSNGTNSFALRAANNMSSNVSFTWPVAAGAIGQALTIAGANQLGWSTPQSQGAQYFGPPGAVASPAYTFTADSDTGIYNPAADTMAFSTGGMLRMSINGQGLVGIGTITPAYHLDIASATAGANIGAQILASNATSRSSFSARNSSNYYTMIGTAGPSGGLGAGGMDNSMGYLMSTGVALNIITGAVGSPIGFYTNGYGAINERMRITAEGSVGIGTSTPSASLHINGKIAVTGSMPTISTCGTGASLVAGSSDTRGVVNTGSSPVSACTITFNTPFSSTPVCVVSWNGTPSVQHTVNVNAVSTAGMNIAFVGGTVTSASFSYICIQ